MNTDGIPSLIDELKALLHKGGSGSPPSPPLNTGGEGGRFPDMEARVAKLEAHMEHVRDDLKKLSSVPADLAEIKAKVDALPDKDWVGAKMRNWVGGGVAFLTLVTLATKFLHL